MTPSAATGRVGALLDAWNRYATATAPLPVYFPDEALLIKAEALARQNNLPAAIAALYRYPVKGLSPEPRPRPPFWDTLAPGQEVEVTVRDGELVVRDHGPGIDPADLPFVFDRFYRSPSARRLPGSGLGLAIVRQVAESHGGKVGAEPAPGGGALLRLSLPTVAGQ